MDNFLRKLAEVKSAMKAGRFDKKLLVKADALKDVLKHERNQIEQDKVNYLKSKCMIAEVYDYFGKTDEAINLMEEEGGKFFKEIQNKSITSNKHSKSLVREKIRFFLIYSQVLLYRKHKYKPFIDRVLLCSNVISEINDPKFPCFGSQAQIAYQLARAYRQINQFDKAEEFFARSIHFYYERGEQKRREYERSQQNSTDKDQYQDELSFSSYRAAISLGLGLGWVHFTKGLLTSALRNNILPARIMLAHTEDSLNKAYLDILFGAVRRCLAGNCIEELESAIRTISCSYQTLESLGHKRYLARSAYELSLAHLYLSYLFRQHTDAARHTNQIDQARKRIDEVLDISQCMSDWRWISNAYTVKSRIERWSDNHKKAEGLATEALLIAEQHEQLLCQIDARLARGKARMKLGDVNGATEDFEEADRLNKRSSSPHSPLSLEPRNPRVQAVCYLNLAQICVKGQQEQQAREYLARANDLLKGVEHVIIHSFAKRVERDIDSLNSDFIIRVEDFLKDQVVSPDYEEALKRFLMRQAYLRTTKDAQAARLLGISRAKFIRWKNKYPEYSD